MAPGLAWLLGCSPASPCPSEAVISLGAGPAPLLPLAWGSPSLSAPHPPSPLPQVLCTSEQKHKGKQSQGPALGPRAQKPLVGLQRGWCPPQQGGETPLPCCTQPAQLGGQGLFLDSGGDQDSHCPGHGEGAEHLPHGLRPQERPRFPTSTGTRHIPSPAQLTSPAQLPRGKALMAAKGSPQTRASFSAPSVVLGTNSHL